MKNIFPTPSLQTTILTCLLFVTISFGKKTIDPIIVSVKGMVCDFCAQGLKKSFLKKEKVDSIHVNLEEGFLTIYPREGQKISDKTIQKRIRDNGISVESIQRSNKKG